MAAAGGTESHVDGLAGVGKTVLLNEIGRKAHAAGYHTISLEAPYQEESGSLAGLNHQVKRGLAVLRILSFPWIYGY